MTSRQWADKHARVPKRQFPRLVWPQVLAHVGVDDDRAEGAPSLVAASAIGPLLPAVPTATGAIRLATEDASPQTHFVPITMLLPPTKGTQPQRAARASPTC